MFCFEKLVRVLKNEVGFSTHQVDESPGLLCGGAHKSEVVRLGEIKISASYSDPGHTIPDRPSYDWLMISA